MMIKRRALRKMLVTTISLFIIMCVYVINDVNNDRYNTIDVLYVDDLANSSIYLLDENNYLVKTKVILDGDSILDKARSVINNLKINNNSDLKAVIPSNVLVNDIKLEDDLVIVDFSKEFLDVDFKDSEKIIEAVVFSLTELDNINKVIIKVNGKIIDSFPNTSFKIVMPLTRDIGINKEYTYNSLEDVVKLTLFYGEKINNNTYYVPLTKYINNEEDVSKIKLIVKELTSSYIYENNLRSVLDEDVSLITDKIIDDVLILNFNKALLGEDAKIKEEVLYTLSYSLFANTSVKALNFKVDDVGVKIVKRSDLV